MNQNVETLENWDKVALLYQEKFMDLNIYDETYDFFCESIEKENSNILEIGCGPGNISRYLLRRRPYFSILGIDTSSKMIELARINNPKAKYEVMDCRAINITDTNFDGIICGFCLPYLSETESKKLICDCNDLLSAKGTLYISFVEGEKDKSGFQVSSTGDRFYFNYHSLSALKQSLNENGFGEPKIFRVNYNRSEEIKEVHTIIITRKK